MKKLHHRAKVKPEIVEEARKLHEEGESPKELARRYQVSINTLNDWIYYRTRINTDLQI